MGYKLMLLAFAGALGTLARFGLSGAVNRLTEAVFPWGTLAVNSLGCLIVGILYSFFDSRLTISDDTRSLVFVGFMGAFTTFSAFALETGNLLKTTNYLMAASNVFLQLMIGVAMVFAGMFLGRLL